MIESMSESSEIPNSSPSSTEVRVLSSPPETSKKIAPKTSEEVLGYVAMAQVAESLMKHGTSVLPNPKKDDESLLLEMTTESTPTIADRVQTANDIEQRAKAAGIWHGNHRNSERPEVTQQKMEEFDRLLREGRSGEFTVVSTSGARGNRVVRLRSATGEEVSMKEAFSEATGYLDTEIPDGLSLDDLTPYMREQILHHESNPGDLSLEFIVTKARSLLAYKIDIPKYREKEVPVGRLRRILTRKPTKVVTEAIPEVERKELAKRLEKIKADLYDEFEFRLILALATRQAEKGQKDEFYQSMPAMQREGFQFLAYKLDKERPTEFKIREGIRLIEENNRELYRPEYPAEADETKKAITKIIANRLRAVTGPDISDEDIEARAKKTYEIAENLIKITGMATYYGGATTGEHGSGELVKKVAIEEMRRLYQVDKSNGVPPDLRRGFAPGKVDMTKAEFWETVARLKREHGVHYIPTAYGGDASRRDRDVGFNNQGVMVTAFNAPEKTRERIPEEYALGLLPNLDTRVENFVFYKGQESLSGLLDYLETEYEVSGGKIVTNADGEYVPVINAGTGEIVKKGEINVSLSLMTRGDLAIWAGLLKGGNELADAYPEFLHRPIISPDVGNENIDPKVIEQIMAPLKKISEKMQFLRSYHPIKAGEMPQEMAENLLEQLVKYHDGEGEYKNEARRLYGWDRWRDNTKSAVLVDMAKAHIIRVSMLQQAYRSLGIHATFAGLWNNWLEIKEGWSSLNKGLGKIGQQALAEAIGEATKL